MTDNTQHIGPSTLPDLPGLETAFYRIGEMVPYAIVYCLLSVIHAVIIAAVYKNIALLDLEMYCGLMVLIGGWLLYKRKTNYLEYRTIPEGLVIKSRFGRKHYSWNDITSATRTKSKDGKDEIKLGTAQESIVIRYSRSNERMQYCRLVASIWQHLRKYHKSNGITLLQQELSFWTPVELPTKTQYPYPMGYALVLVMMLGSVVIVWAGVTFFSTCNVTPTLLVLPLLTFMIGSGLFAPFIMPVFVVHVNNRGMWGYKGLFKVSMTWNEATDIKTNGEGTQITAAYPSRCFVIVSLSFAMLFTSRSHRNPINTEAFRSKLKQDDQLTRFILGCIRLNNPKLAVFHPDMIAPDNINEKMIDEGAVQDIAYAEVRYLRSATDEDKSHSRLIHNLVVMPFVVSFITMMFVMLIGYQNIVCKVTGSVCYYINHPVIAVLTTTLSITLLLSLFLLNRVTSNNQKIAQIGSITGWTPTLRKVFIYLAVFSIIVSLLCLNNSFMITQNSIQAGLPFPPFVRTYGFNDISDITYTESYNRRYESYYSIIMRDGYTITANEGDSSGEVNIKSPKTTIFAISQNINIPIKDIIDRR